MNIRPLHSDEVPFLADMLYEAVFVPEGQEPYPKDIIHHKDLAKYIEHWGKDAFDIALVAETENLLVGAIWGRLFTEQNKGFGFIDNQTPEISMAIRSEFRNKGLGTELLDSIAGKYQQKGILALCLSVDKANKACRLYQRNGYTIVGEVNESWTMKKRI